MKTAITLPALFHTAIMFIALYKSITSGKKAGKTVQTENRIDQIPVCKIDRIKVEPKLEYPEIIITFTNH
jgi:hypothetical protein